MKQLRKPISLMDVGDDLFWAVSDWYRKESKYDVYCDVETTGLDTFRNDVITLALVIGDKSHNVLDKRLFKIRPVSFNYWSAQAQAVHGITQVEASQFPSPRKTCIDILHFLKPFKHQQNIPLTFVFHANGGFDFRFINALFYKQDLQYSLYKVIEAKNILSTIDLAKQKGIPHGQRSLDKLCDRYGIELNHHEVMSDTMACYEIHKRLMSV